MSQDLILIGRIGAPWGIRGDNWVQLYTDSPADAFKYAPWVLRRPHPVKKGAYVDAPWELKPPKGRVQAKGWVCRLTDSASRNDAETYKGLEIWVSRSCLPELPSGEYYHHELVGCRVVNTAAEDLGSVSEVLETGANDVLVVRGDDKAVDDAERLLPWIDSVVINVDLSESTVTVDWQKDF